MLLCSVCSVCGVYVYPYCREVDEDLRVVHSGADGFVEQVEGWAFLMAVLPRINDCDAAVATTVIENVQIRNSDSDPRAFNRFGEGCGVNAKGASSEADPAAHSYAPAHCTMKPAAMTTRLRPCMRARGCAWLSCLTLSCPFCRLGMVKDGFQTVIAAVEGTFECLKVACSDLNTMYGSADRVGVGTPSADACPHWNACEDGATLPREAAAVLPDPTCGEPAVGPDRTAGASRVSAVTAVVMAAIAAAVVV